MNDPDSYRRHMMAAFTFAQVRTSGAQAYGEWLRLRAAGPHWPIIIGGEDDLANLADQFAMMGEGANVPAAEATIRASEQLAFSDVLRSQPGTAELLTAYSNAPWPASPPAAGSGPDTIIDFATRQPRAEAILLQIPTSIGWEVPAYLRWGGWNACPPPEVHVAALRSWHDRFGCELVAVTGDFMEMKVAHRPQNRQEALALAEEHFLYCPDVVEQGVGSIPALAAFLMVSDWWHFWWD